VASERRPARLDLSQPRAYGELLSTTFELFGRHASVLLTLALVVVTPVTLLIDGVWGRALADGLDAKPPLEAETAGAAVRVFLVLPLVTAADVLAVQGLGRGIAPAGVGDALRAGARVLPRVLGAVVLYVAAVLAGCVLFILPGVWLAIRCYFAAQVAAVDGVGPVAAMRRSSDLVQGAWWRTFGCVVATAVLLGFGGSAAIGVLGATGSGALYVAGLIVVEAVALTLGAIFAALLFFDLHARRGRPVDDLPDKMGA
jgi:hypothetical protein